MSDQFKRCEQDLIGIIKSAKTKLADEIPIADREERKGLLRQVNKNLEDMEITLQDMEAEAMKSGPNAKLSMQTKIKQYRRDVEIIQKDWKKANSSNNYSSYGSMNTSRENLIDPERKKVLQIEQSLLRTNDSIARSTQVAIETEQIGNEVLGELNNQGEKLKRTNERLDETGQSLTKTRRILHKLSTNLVCNKFFLFILVILELIILGAVIYWKFFMKK